MSNPDRPFGWRKRIGLLSPTVIETAAYDFYRLAPDGVSMCATTSNSIGAAKTSSSTCSIRS
jgi:maleate cis-trans isomerase